MSDMLTHWASFEDCRQLSAFDPEIEPEFSTWIEKAQDFARLGALSFGGKTWMEPMMREAREHWDDRDRDPRYERNLGFVLGGLIHQACDRVMKPYLSERVNADWGTMQEAMRQGKGEHAAQTQMTQELSAYVDAEVFRKVYADGDREPMSRFFMAELSPGGKDLERLVRAMFQRAMLSAHTLRPDMDDMPSWLDNLYRKVQPLYLDVDLWVKVYNHPDPERIKAFAIAETFYRDDDPVIRAARALEAGRPIDKELSRSVFELHEANSAYGEILQLGLEYLRNATAYWRGEASSISAPNYERGTYQPRPVEEAIRA